MAFNSNQLKKIKLNRVFLLLLIWLIYPGCKSKPKEFLRELISFSEVNGISYTEVYRGSANGLSFTKYGFRQEPQWRMRFLSGDSVSIYSPDRKRFYNFVLSRGYDSIFNTARVWLKMKKISKDSLVFQLLTAKSDSLNTKGEDVYMTLYADKYIKDVLHTSAEVLQRPGRKDTLFVKALIDKANNNYDSTFVAQQSVMLTPKSPQVKVAQKKATPNVMNDFSTTSDYLDPEYDITINKAYRNFYYTFTIVIDDKGKMHYGKPLVPFTEEKFRDAYVNTSTAVMNSYLAYYLQVTPGKTLGMPHASVITVNVTGTAK
ncbi:MAG: hypothetical protein EOP54_16985 [Sphingobacteriales bacterium]|nr:MAG: hypothetical protein EOP54_16985 [Sphingobacteriales bacterium]